MGGLIGQTIGISQRGLKIREFSGRNSNEGSLGRAVGWEVVNKKIKWKTELNFNFKLI